MTQSIVLFSKSPNLLLEIDRQLEGKHQLISCETLDGLQEKLSGREINAVLSDPRIRARLVEVGGTVLAGTSADFGKLIADETEKWGKVIRAANIKPE